MSRVGYVYDEIMELHKDPRNESPEKPERIKGILKKLKQQDWFDKLVEIPSKKASMKALELVHTKEYIEYVKNTPVKTLNKESDGDMYYNEHSIEAARYAVGSVINITHAILQGEIDCGFAIVRPPGHHAFADQGAGFCIFNNVATAAVFCAEQDKQVLIIDWDIHHGDGTEDIVEKYKNILFFSIQRHYGHNYKYDKDDFFYPGTGESKIQNNIIDVGLLVQGTNKIYLDQLDNYTPIFKRFKPDIILVSCGFDAVSGDTLGDFKLTPKGYGAMVKKLKEICPHILLVLEGGYNVSKISECAVECVSKLF